MCESIYVRHTDIYIVGTGYLKADFIESSNVGSDNHTWPSCFPLVIRIDGMLLFSSSGRKQNYSRGIINRGLMIQPPPWIIQPALPDFSGF